MADTLARLGHSPSALISCPGTTAMSNAITNCNRWSCSATFFQWTIMSSKPVASDVCLLCATSWIALAASPCALTCFHLLRLSSFLHSHFKCEIWNDLQLVWQFFVLDSYHNSLSVFLASRPEIAVFRQFMNGADKRFHSLPWTLYKLIKACPIMLHFGMKYVLNFLSPSTSKVNELKIFSASPQKHR